ncbi:MAG TPA: MFS transporter [Candidatus Eisenbergiella merdavium]|uniref:MFS transporter n=1 Tax=Candidatus Eisenbergiella merdavium TaxID=2838551 RepID=A0A9D2NH18_9FIRM|nr:MFS transporter [Candidatus Eisenbergiella merdavium]
MSYFTNKIRRKQFSARRQLKLLYMNTSFGAFQIAGASWVALLAARGFSLVEIGFAESVFHVASLLFEVPSGVISDVFGRKRSMVLSQCMTILSALLMLCSDSLAGVLPAMVFSAFGYNFLSGTREALAWETLKADGREAEYDGYASTDMMLYTFFSSLATLCAGLALTLGYRRAYLIDIGLGALGLTLALRLKEIGRPRENGKGAPGAASGETVWKQVFSCLRESGRFLLHSRKAMELILQNAAVGAAATLLRFFLQARLPEKGLPDALLGPALFLMGLGGAAGARLILCCKSWSYTKVFAVSAAVVTGCVAASLLPVPAVMVVGGFLAALSDNFLQVRSDVRLNEMVPAEQRATLISVSSLCFSAVMIVLSPLFGILFS